MKKAKCPNCEEIIESLEFESDVTQWGLEWGTADLEGEQQSWDDSEYNDGETNETRYKCPECSQSIQLGDLKEYEDEEEEEEEEELNEDGKPIKKQEEEAPKISLREFSPSHGSNRQQVISLICPNCGCKDNPIDQEELGVLCNKCGEELIKNKVQIVSFGKTLN